ncbi:LysR family transcriptional regulator [Stutzerimonas nosocomialis]|uniref:LysR family transcriptional regulator n=1 Tax=Stutzerimonas nosocomialis TaxID=1056496 RepID=A0A5R9QV00_9GAMM|nr:LysR family transcriptional regulator [Stutzerimonas nosocomialis]TLX63205.1 LysR family transcriptional regulator [Stutzerimonas nosocomialis]
MSTDELAALLPGLAVLVQVVETGSFSAVARQQGSTASAVSRQIARLEQTLSLRLLERTTRKLRLTDAGEEVYGHALELMAAARAVADVGERLMQSPRGRVRLSVPKALGRFVINPLLPQFLRRYPDVDLQVQLSDRSPDLIDDHFDLVVRVGDQPPEGLAGRPITQVRQLLCASPDYLDAHGEPHHPQELLRHSCLFLAETADDHRWHFRRGDEQEVVAVRGRYACNHSEARLLLAREGFGITCLPHFTAAEALARGELREVLADWRYTGSYQGAAWLLWRPNRQLPPSLRALIDYLAQQLDGR